MRLRIFTDNSLRSLIYLALKPDNRVIISELSENFAMSRNHLVKVIHFLAKQGFVQTTKGRGGGLHLARPASEISVGSVVRCVEGGQEVINCFNPVCPIAANCRLQGVFRKARESFFQVLDEYSIADLTDDRATLRTQLGIEDARPDAVATPADKPTAQ